MDFFLKTRKILFTFIFISLIFITTVAWPDKTPDLPEMMEPQSGWSMDKENPIISAGDYIEKAIWNDPCVLKVKNDFVMYMTSSVKVPFEPPILPYRAISSDGKSWRISPKKPLFTQTATPFVSIETPNVIFFEEKYHMYYTGVYASGSFPTMAIGHAISNDGINWDGDYDPILVATGDVQDWNGFLVAEPGAVVFKGKIHLYFTAMGNRQEDGPQQLQSIGLAVSNDGKNFSNQLMILQQSSKYPTANGFIGYSTPSAVVYNNELHLFYDVVIGEPRYRQVSIHHAISADGIFNFIEDARPIFTCESFDWTLGEIRSPTALFDNGLMKLWFAGNVKVESLGPMIRRGFKGNEVGIGYAVRAIK